jgi:hypothetical protein
MHYRGLALEIHFVSKKSGQLNVSITPEQADFIAALAEHRITGPELVRGLIDAAAAFHAEHGWFSFPLTITPVKFQQAQAPKPGRKSAA